MVFGDRMPCHEADRGHIDEEPIRLKELNAPNASPRGRAGAAVVTDARDIMFALRGAPMFADASHHANVGALVRFCPDATQRREVIAGRALAPTHGRVLAPCVTCSGRGGNVPGEGGVDRGQTASS